MDIDIEIANTTRQAVDQNLVKTVAGRVVAGEMGGTEGLNVEVSVAFVTPQKIKALNSKWRRIDRATDVLSFGQDDFLSRFAKKSCSRMNFWARLSFAWTKSPKTPRS